MMMVDGKMKNRKLEGHGKTKNVAVTYLYDLTAIFRRRLHERGIALGNILKRANSGNIARGLLRPLEADHRATTLAAYHRDLLFDGKVI